MIRAFDWSRTPVGPVARWPQSLRTAVSILLASGYPMYIAWGPEYVQFYNDAYRPILGSSKHPAALGQGTSECFAEIWQIIGPMFQGVMSGGPATSYHDFLLPLDRFGYVEECYFDFSYSAVRDESGGVGGVFVTCSETTGRVIGERRLSTLRELGAGARYGTSVEAAFKGAALTLAGNPHDLPFALLYLVDAAGSTAQLAGAAGMEEVSPAAPRQVPLDGSDASGWPLGEILRSRKAMTVDVAARFGTFSIAPWPEPVRSALLLPIIQVGERGEEQVASMLVAGVSPRRSLDDEYRGFLELIVRQLATVMANARAYRSAVERAEALAELDRAKTAFFSNISHEFRTPLTLSLGPIEDILERSAASGDGTTGAISSTDRDQLQMVHRNTLRLLKLVNTLLEFSRLEAGRAQVSLQPTDLAAVTADLASVFRAAVERAGLELVIDAERLPQPVQVDREMWEKIILNLLSNAFKFTFTGTIRVSVREGAAGAVVTVSDTGSGIPADELPRVFDRFHRVRTTRSRTHEGTGIGLALVKELVEIHGGSVSVESEVGRGSTFTITIPRRAADPSSGRVAAPEAASPSHDAIALAEEADRWLPGSEPAGMATPLEEPLPRAGGAGLAIAGAAAGARVLVADDNRDMREYLARLLSQYFAVETVADGREALARAIAAPPDLVVTDVMMPVMDGFELLRALRANPRMAGVPVLMLSARAGEEATIEGLEGGADDYLTKPFTARELVARVRANLLMARARSAAAASVARYEAAEGAQLRAHEVLLAVARQLDSTSDLMAFFGELTARVSGLVQGERAVFWLLDEQRQTLSVQPGGHGFTPAIMVAMRDLPCRPDGEDIAELIVYRDLTLGPSNLADPRFAPYREWLDIMGVRDVIATAWRAGDRPLGILTAYDSRRPEGFTEEDTWVLRIAALAAGLVWQQKMAEQALEDARLHEAEQLRAQVERMTELDRVKSEFLKLASHELRGPLSVLRGYLDMIVGETFGPPSPRLTPIYPILLAKVDEMNRLVNRMLETARLEENRLVLSLGDIDLSAVVRESVATLEPLRAETHRFELSLPDHPVLVYGDEQRLASVVTNLLENAVKYSPAGGRIAVACAVNPEGTAVSLTITDQGIGIDAEDLPRLFSRFGRIVNADNSHIQGAGLGLYLAREIAHLHGGEVTISSIRHRGTAATFTMPLAAADDLPGPARSAASPFRARA
ncbi:MAG: ATP-binding protein [Candidatus Dormibacter sp.]